MSNNEDFIRDMITMRSASTYILLQDKFRVSVNTSVDKTRFLGSVENPIYPEIIIWDTITKETIAVECIETESTYEFNVEKWRRILSLNPNLTIVVPYNSVLNVQNLISNSGLNIKKVQAYKILGVNKEIKFYDV